MTFLRSTLAVLALTALAACPAPPPATSLDASVAADAALATIDASLSSDAASQGTLGGPCFPNNTCMPDLTCSQGTCQSIPLDASTPDSATLANDGSTSIEPDAASPGPDAGAPDAACSPKSDQEECALHGFNCGTPSLSDSCGTQRPIPCGTCSLPTPWCNPATNACECLPYSDAVFCDAYNACVTKTATDNCGATRTVECTPARCKAPKICDAAGTCSCTAETDAQLCAAAGWKCGTLSVKDKCDVLRAVNCGGCAYGELCTAAPNRACCTPWSESFVCSTLNLTCDWLDFTDNCGQNRSTVCQALSCVQPLYCGGQGSDNPNQCAKANCAVASDQLLCFNLGRGCGITRATDPFSCPDGPRLLNCGACPGSETCGLVEAGTCANATGAQCVSESNADFCKRHGRECSPDSSHTLTGTDNCGKYRSTVCPTCSAPTSKCVWSTTPKELPYSRCIPPVTNCMSDETNADLCVKAGSKNCGTVTVPDGCGVLRTINCGTCAAPQICGGTGLLNVCGQPFNPSCVSESHDAFCTRYAPVCGPFSGPDNCGWPRQESCDCASGYQCLTTKDTYPYCAIDPACLGVVCAPGSKCRGGACI